MNGTRLSIQFSDAGDGYIMAECLDIPGCVSQGRTHAEALANLTEAISVCLEVILEDAAAKTAGAPAPLDLGRYELSLSTAELLPAA
ncbi:MAG: type II toxin-antitoxin system HicB family antitoxin [Acidobacteriota bacterium]